MWPLKQKEIVVSVLRLSEERAPPNHPLRFLRDVYSFAKDGLLVDEGQITEFAYGFMGNPHIGGLVYARPRKLDGISLRSGVPYIAAFLLTRPEAEAVKSFGMTRVLSLLAHRYRCFPYPMWSDRTRTDSLIPCACASSSSSSSLSALSGPCCDAYATDGDSDQRVPDSLLKGADRVCLLGARAWIVDGRMITLRLLVGDSAVLRDILRGIPDPVERPLAFLTAYNEDADEHLVWSPSDVSRSDTDRAEGSTRIAATAMGGAGGRKVGGSFVCFCSGRAEDEGAVEEDGFAVYLTDESWKVLKECLAEGQRTVMIADTERGKNFEIVWADEPNRPFARPRRLFAGDEPAAGARPIDGGASQVARVKTVAFLTSEEDVANRTNVEEFSAYVSLLCGIVEKLAVEHVVARQADDDLEGEEPPHLRREEAEDEAPSAADAHQRAQEADMFLKVDIDARGRATAETSCRPEGALDASLLVDVSRRASKATPFGLRLRDSGPSGSPSQSSDPFVSLCITFCIATA